MNHSGLSSDRPRASEASPPIPAAPPTLVALPRRYLIDAGVRRAATAPDAPPRLRVTGRDTETGQAVFIKLGNDGESIRHEASILRRLDHPGLARLLDWGMHAAGGYLILELVPGTTLERRLRDDGPARSTRQVRPLLTAMAEAIDTVHAAGILHRDLKPANVVVRPGGAPVIIDFGAARGRSASEPAEAAEDFVSEGYAAPEQYQTDGREGPWSDVYALAAIAYRVLVGAPPPPAPLRMAEAGEALPLLERIALADPPLAEALIWGLRVDPDARPQSVAAWIAALATDGDTADTPGLADAPMPPIAGHPLLAVPPAEATDNDEGPPTLPIRRGAAAGTAPAYTAAAGGAASPRAPVAVASAGKRSRAWQPLLLAAALLAVIGWLAAPTYRRQVMKEWTVSADGTGDTRSIGEAVAQAPDGAHIRIASGSYAESLVLDRPMQLEAADPDAPPQLSPAAGPCLNIAGNDEVVVRGLVMRGAAAASAAVSPTGKAPAAPACVLVEGGAPVLEGNRISAAGGPAISVEDGAAPLLRGNTIVESATPSIRIADGARPTLEDNTIEGSGSVLFTAGGGGTFRGNRILDAHGSAVQVAAGAAPQIIGNAIERPTEAGIFIYDGGQGHIRDNDIVEAKLSGIVVANGDPDIVDNRIRRSGEHGVLILATTGARVVDNEIEGNKGQGIVVGADCVVDLSGNRTDGNRTPEIVDLRRH